MKRLLILVVMAGLLSGCDNSDKHISVTSDAEANKGESIIIDVSHFPDYVGVNGKRIYPDTNNPVSDAGTSNAIYNFQRVTPDGRGSIFSTFEYVHIMRCESDCITPAYNWMMQKDGGSTAWRTITGAINYAMYDIYDSAYQDTSNSISYAGEVKGWN
ncbi:hypothetical protein [Enterobacter roggenkampii]|uniref:hypothetical protein n=1 Tax=Enterobacter roggenkampii TaxID=1812935 RepID=UPI0007507651|nr:hypothetical protein [Enterobacter roggenkampii]AYA11481.1 hypothetical protein AM452_08400 [Enterobacter cloacae]